MKKNVPLILISLLIVFTSSRPQSTSEYVKIFQFDYSNIKTPLGQKLIPVYESIDYYLSLLFRKYEVKDYNYFHQMYRYLNQKKICKNKIKFNYDNSSLVQKDISFLIVPTMEHLSKIKKSKYVFHSTLCIGDFEIPRTIIITLKYGDEKALENVLNDELKKKYIFNELVKIIFSKTILDYHDLKRNKIISPFPQYYSYFSSYEKFAYLTNIKYNYKKYYDYFGDIGKYSSWPEMPYFNDYLSKKKFNSLDSSFTEITLNLLDEYPYEVQKCDLLYNYDYFKKRCLRVDQKCIDICSFEHKFLEYYIDEKNKKFICNLNDNVHLMNKKCSNLYGNVYYNEYFEINNVNKFLEAKKSQNLLLLKPDMKCKNKERTIFFEYSDYYRDDPYFYKKNKINVEFAELNDPEYFVIAKVDKYNYYLTKFKNLIFNNIFVKNIDNWNYNLYWDSYPQLFNDQGTLFNLNKYQLIGKFPDNCINKHNITSYYQKLKNKYPQEFDYMPEAYFIPTQNYEIKKKFKKYSFNTNNAWIIKKNENDNNNNEYPHIIKSFDNIDSYKEEMILSKYIDNPLLINDKKFIMRTFVLVTGFSPLKIYFYRDGYLIFSQLDYSLTEKNIDNECIHIASEKNEDSCKKKYENKNNLYENSLFEKNCSVWNFLNLERYCKKNDINYQDIINQAKDIITKTFISLREDIINSYKQYNIKDRNMFQLFTFDFIIDSNKKLYLIDTDKNPKLDSKHLVPIYIYDHLFSDILNIVGLVPFSHKEIQKTYDESNTKYNNDEEENVEDAICEFGRYRGIFELAFPLKNNIEKYKKYFGKDMGKENQMLWDYIKKN